MPNYSYRARDLHGNPTAGVIYAETDAELRDKLRGNGLYLTNFKKTAEGSEKSRKSIFAKKVKLTDLVVMSRQFATLVRAGLPIIETLGTLRVQTENPLIAEALTEIQQDVMAGGTLNQSMAKHPAIFNNLYVFLAAAGEASGTLDKTLEIVADQLEKEAVIQEQVKSAMAYPKLVVFACFGVVAFMLVFIVPVFSKVYTQFNASLPFITQLLITMSDIVTRFWWMTLIVIYLGFRGFVQFRKTEQGKRIVDRYSLKLPILGPILRKIAISRFTQTFAGATRSGVPILNGLAVSADTSGNSVIRDAVIEVANRVSEGAPLAATLDQTKVFPAMVTRMIAAGEKSGNLDEMLDEITKFYQRDVDYAITRMTKLIEPLMTILVGGIVLFVLMALYMPVFNLGKVLKK
jgi:type IV pilus assembly protein PilC